MSGYFNELHRIRDSVCAIMKIHLVQSESPAPPQFQVSFVGTAWCIVPNRMFVTAWHVFNNGNQRLPADRFYIFAVPQNGPVAFNYLVRSFICEEAASDMAVLEIDPADVVGLSIPSVPVTYQRIPDGEKVLTCGFPAPVIAQANVDLLGNWAGGQLLLKSHANEGIVSAQYSENNLLTYELNVCWHHGESGGPIFQTSPLSAFSIMQQYRAIQTPHGTVAGPHIGKSIVSICNALNAVGATIV